MTDAELPDDPAALKELVRQYKLQVVQQAHDIVQLRVNLGFCQTQLEQERAVRVVTTSAPSSAPNDTGGASTVKRKRAGDHGLKTPPNAQRASSAGSNASRRASNRRAAPDSSSDEDLEERSVNVSDRSDDDRDPQILASAKKRRVSYTLRSPGEELAPRTARDETVQVSSRLEEPRVSAPLPCGKVYYLRSPSRELSYFDPTDTAPRVPTPAPMDPVSSNKTQQPPSSEDTEVSSPASRSARIETPLPPPPSQPLPRAPSHASASPASPSSSYNTMPSLLAGTPTLPLQDPAAQLGPQTPNPVAQTSASPPILQSYASNPSQSTPTTSRASQPMTENTDEQQGRPQRHMQVVVAGVRVRLMPPMMSEQAREDRLSGCPPYEVSVETELRAITTPRNFLHEIFGGGTNAVGTISDTGDNLLYLPLAGNAHLPLGLGAAGLLFSATLERAWKVGRQKLFVGLSEGKYWYVGDYDISPTLPLSAAEYKAWPWKARHDWARTILRPTKKHRDIRCRVMMRRKLGREPTDVELITALDTDDKCSAVTEDNIR